KQEMSGFGHAHEGSEHGHGHEKENGFNLREVELFLTGEVDDLLIAEAVLAFSEDKTEVETAFVQTTSLPGGLALKGGKFFSGFGITNPQHPHQWSFADKPLIYELALGDHGLNEVGLQATWQADVPFLLEIGMEALQGRNEAFFDYKNEDLLPRHNGPRIGVGWLKLSPKTDLCHTVQFGLFGAGGVHQEIHEEEGPPAETNHFDGVSWFAGADAFYHYNAHGNRGQGDLTLQAEYFYRKKELAPEGGTEKIKGTQDGYYCQVLYGFMPRWRGGLRWDQVGLINKIQEDGVKESFGDSWRGTAMVDFSSSQNSMIRFQIAGGDYETEEGAERVWEGYLQFVLTLGSHGHHGEYVCFGH
ncbi:MAG TPA: hypothetical protein VIR63_03110, partial [Pontiella sp.]